MSAKLLVYGSTGFVGSALIELIQRTGGQFFEEIQTAKANCLDTLALYEELDAFNGTHVLICVGFTSDFKRDPTSVSSSDIDKRGLHVKSFKSNVLAPVNVINVVNDHDHLRSKLHVTYVGTACVLGKRWETSSYVREKGVVDTYVNALIKEEPNLKLLHVRIRAPVTSDTSNPKNLPVKLRQHLKEGTLLEHGRQSISVLNHTFGVSLVHLLRVRITGAVNMVNVCPVSNREVLRAFFPVVRDLAEETATADGEEETRKRTMIVIPDTECYIKESALQATRAMREK